MYKAKLDDFIERDVKGIDKNIEGVDEFSGYYIARLDNLDLAKELFNKQKEPIKVLTYDFIDTILLNCYKPSSFVYLTRDDEGFFQKKLNKNDVYKKRTCKIARKVIDKQYTKENEDHIVYYLYYENEN